jgi:hypothetical protein
MHDWIISTTFLLLFLRSRAFVASYCTTRAVLRVQYFYHSYTVIYSCRSIGCHVDGQLRASYHKLFERHLMPMGVRTVITV